MIQLLIANPLLLLFLVAAIGYAVGRVRFFGSSLGVAAVLFVGLAFGALDPNIKLPEVIYLIGLTVFVYTIGLSSGAGFFASLRGQGLRDNVFVAAVLALLALMAAGIHFVLDLKGTITAGLFAGSLTNTPALAAILDFVKINTPPELVDQVVNEPVIGYSIAYPMGFLGMIAAIAIAQRIWRPDYAREAEELRDLGVTGEQLESRTVRVTCGDVVGRTVQDLQAEFGWDVVFGRLRRDDQLLLSTGETTLQAGDLVSIIGAHDNLVRVVDGLGELSPIELPLDRSEMDFRRIFVSNQEVAGRRLGDLNLPQRFGAVVTRVRRGDIELLPRADTVLELGDRVRVVTRRDNMEVVSDFFGDSYRALSEIDILSFNLGLGVGILVGLIPIPLPGGVTLQLGYAGGPLIVALLLGAMRRTGPIVWTLPYSANLTLRQVGLVLFLAGVGTRSGYAFVNTLMQGGGLALFFAGMLMTATAAFVTLLVGYKLLRIPASLTIGVLAGLQTNPAVLGYAVEQTKNDLPLVGYTTVYPVATIVKIVLAQLLLALLR